MAFEESIRKITLLSAADFSTTGQFRFGQVNSSGQVALAGSGARVDCVVYDNPDAASRETTVVIAGVAMVELGGTVTAGDQVQSGASGVATSGSTNTPGVALESGVSGDIIPVLLKL